MAAYGNAGKKGGLQPGDLLSTEDAQLFIYLGYYKGRARIIDANIIDPVKAGYLYVRVRPYGQPDIGSVGISDDQYIFGDTCLLDNLKPERFETGWASYLKEPKRFVAKHRTIDLSPVWDRLERVNGLVRARQPAA